MGSKSSFWLIGGAFALIWILKGKGLPNGVVNTVSADQLQQTANFETFRPTVYDDGVDSNGNQAYSIGYGHQLLPGESFPNGISQADALTLLQSDMQNVVDAINNAGQSFTQGQFDALGDFGYSAGIGAMNKAINIFTTNGASAVPDYFTQYVYWHPDGPGTDPVLSQNLVNRRNVEVQTWNS
jgi:GH24 family phage-related lysozyme (muramidase)